MIIDSSAMVAVLREEPEAEVFTTYILKADVARLSAAGYMETGIVIDGGRNPASSRRVDSFIAESGIMVEPVTATQARIAREAYRDFGKGSGHAAGLNFGDCFAYALAKDKTEALLFKGTDFDQTDVETVRAEIVQD